MDRAVGSGRLGPSGGSPGSGLSGLAVAATGVAIAVPGLLAPGAADAAGPGSTSPRKAGADTVRVPRAAGSPTLDCEIGEWPARGRLHLRPELPDVVVRGDGQGASGTEGAGGMEAAADMTVRLELQWSPDTLWVMADVEDDSVEGGIARGGDWVQLGVDATALWIAAPGEAAPAARLGTRATGQPVGSVSACRTRYGWRAEVALPARELANDPALGTIYDLGLFAEDDDGEAEGVRRAVMWREAPAFLGPAAEEPEESEGLLDRLREDTVTLDELSKRPGARDTAVERGGRRRPAVRLPLAGGVVTAFAPTRTSTDVTYRIDRSETGLLRRLGLDESRAKLELRFGDLRMVRREETFIRSPQFELDLLSGVRIQFFPATPGEVGGPPAAQRPARVYIRFGGASGGGGSDSGGSDSGASGGGSDGGGSDGGMPVSE